MTGAAGAPNPTHSVEKARRMEAAHGPAAGNDAGQLRRIAGWRESREIRRPFGYIRRKFSIASGNIRPV